MSRLANKANAAVSAHFKEKLTPEAKEAFHDAMTSLYEGPGHGGMGFSTAVGILTDWWDEEGSDVWYDVQSEYVLDKEPKGYFAVGDDEDGEPEEQWIEPAWEDYVHYDSFDAKRVFFGSELAPHV